MIKTIKRKQKCLAIFVLAFFFFGLNGQTADAATIRVGGNNGAAIQSALDSAASGDTVIIPAGNYSVTSQIYQKGKSLNLEGEGSVTLNIQTGSSPGIYFLGSVITNTTPSSNSLKGSSQVVLKDASQVRQNDLIRIWKNVQWCPLDYSEQKTGETYLIQSVNGNTVTLNQPLLRDYNLSDTVQVEISRPIEVHVKNIRVQNVSSTGVYEGLMLRYCKDSSVANSWFKDNGQAAIRIFTCFNADITNNEIYDSIHEGNGYGVSVAEASAFVNIQNNHIENCRHDIMSGTADFKALNRDIIISDNVLIGGNIAASHVIDSHPNTIDYLVTRNKIYPKPNYNAFYDGTFQSVFSDNEIYGGHGVVSRRGNLNNGVHIIKDNYIEDSGYLYGGIGVGVGDALMILNNTQVGGWYGLGLNSESFKNITIDGNKLSNFSDRGINLTYLTNGVNLQISNNTFENVAKGGIYINAGSYTNGTTNIMDNVLKNISSGSSSPGITVTNIKNANICSNTISDTSSRMTYGIYEGSGCNNNSIFGNNITGATKRDIYTGGAAMGSSTVCPTGEIVIPEIVSYEGSSSSEDSSDTSTPSTPNTSYYNPTESILNSNPAQDTNPALAAEEKELSPWWQNISSLWKKNDDEEVTPVNFSNPLNTNNPIVLAQNIIHWFLVVSGAVGLLSVIIGGIVYTSSTGDQQKAQQGKTIVVFSIT